MDWSRCVLAKRANIRALSFTLKLISWTPQRARRSARVAPANRLFARADHLLNCLHDREFKILLVVAKIFQLAQVRFKVF